MRRFIRNMTALSALLMVLAGCAAVRSEPDLAKGDTWQPATVAVLPFEAVEAKEAGSGYAVGPLTGSLYTSGPIIPGAASALNSALESQIKASTNLQLIDSAIAADAWRDFSGRGVKVPGLADVAAVGRTLGVDAVFVGFVYRFEQRQGTAAAAENPAAATFNLMLVRSSDARIVFKGVFDERQQALSQNLLNLGQYMRHGLQWYTVEQLGRVGMEQVFETFPWPKESPSAATNQEQ